MPSGVRRLARRLLKAGYWLATPHKIPARLRYRKEFATGKHPDPSFLAFFPNDGSSGHYALTSTPHGYCYVEPRRPEALEPGVDLAVRSANLNRPLFSVVVRVDDTPPEDIRRMLRSVQAQWSSDWELILAGGQSTCALLVPMLAQECDARIRIENATLNQAFAAATGEYVVFLDPADELTPDCLHELALCIAESNPDYLYSDDDKRLPDGNFADPYFKPDWSPDTLMSVMYAAHVCCVRRELVLRIGGLRSEFDGASEWDFALRVSESEAKIAHIPKVLYHRRTALEVAKAGKSGKACRDEAIRRRGLAGSLEPVAAHPGFFRVRYAARDQRVSIIIPSKDNARVLRQCVDSIFSSTGYRNFEIVIVDNGSRKTATHSYYERLKKRGNVTLVQHPVPFNWSELNNVGIAQATGEVLLFLNDDTQATQPEWLERMVGYAALDHIGAVGAKLLYPTKGKVQHNGVVNLVAGPSHAFLRTDPKNQGYFMRNLLEHNWIAVTGACLMVERKKLQRVGIFDTAFAVAYNDVELCFRLLDHGYFHVVCQGAELLHHESLSRGLDHADQGRLQRLHRDRVQLFRKHPKYFAWDPFFSPNLHPDDAAFRVPV